uniref:Uncharacterized protein n=1 Tax=Hyaloperonospora arabidopsidis (strain Emoy2) TaxID=559515 RepID=M4C3J2_HYAAE
MRERPARDPPPAQFVAEQWTISAEDYFGAEVVLVLKLVPVLRRLHLVDASIATYSPAAFFRAL